MSVPLDRLRGRDSPSEAERPEDGERQDWGEEATGARVEGPGYRALCLQSSRFAQPAELPLQRWEGKAPIELLGRVPFPRIGELPYFVTLAPYGFYWFELVDPHGRPKAVTGERRGRMEP